MKITVLGFWGAYPKGGEATSGYLLQTAQHNILLDLGSGVLSKLFCRLQPEELDGVFISHFHHDHSADLGCLLYACKNAKAFGRRVEPLPIHIPENAPQFPELSKSDYAVGNVVAPDREVEIKGLKASFFKTYHEVCNLAVRIEYQSKTLVYTGDLGPKTDRGIVQFCRDADLLICESSLFEREKGLFEGHLTTEEAAQLAAESGAKALLLTHFPHVGDINQMPVEAAKYYNGEIFQAGTEKVFAI
ncbi:MAG: MBL fold metallo-hydrolase [Desulfitobacteriia bacterium]|jgi:ribonuclease BN (tRNA processing enzyme)